MMNNINAKVQDIKSLKEITVPINEDIHLFRKELKDSLRSEVRLINILAKYMMMRRGKHIRPFLTIFSAHICGEPTANSFRAAAMIEMLHVATLIHDDVVDEANLRRGWAALHKKWKNKLSVLMGDYILSKSLINMIKLKDFEVLELISGTAEQMSSGEILQIEKNFRKSVSEKLYYDVISRKTASLFSASCELGSLTTTNKLEDRKAMKDFGQNFGMAFQIKDDLFDLLARESDIGKDVAHDVKKSMITLPYIHSFRTLKKSDQKRMNTIIRTKKKTPQIIRELRNLIEKGGGFDYARNKIEDFSNNAMVAIKTYEDSSYKKSMVDLLVYNTHRTK